MYTVALIGRPNVGKSTLFNRLVGKKIALVDDQPGVTRDRREGFCEYDGAHFRLFDTAGYEDERGKSLEARMQQQTELAVKEADLCLFIYDAREGLTPLDQTFAGYLRKTGSTILLVANKAEGKAADIGIIEGAGLGFGEVMPISAEHGLNIVSLMQKISDSAGDKLTKINEEESFASKQIFKDEDIEEAAISGTDLMWVDAEGSVRVGHDRPLRISVIGRPNVGKSTLINHILGEDRLLTGPEAGITRDSIAVDYDYNGQKITLFDTAGMRRKANIQKKLEKLSVSDTLRSLKYTEIAIILLDANQAFEKQDLQIIELAEKEGRAIVIAINKWDMVEDPSKFATEVREKCARLLPQIKGVPIIFVSGKTGRGIDKLFKATFDIYEHWNGRVSTAQLNKWLDAALRAHPAPIVGRARLKLKYMTQVKTRPPTFVIFSTRPEKLPESYRRYLVNGLREEFDFPGTPIRLELRKRKNPYVDK